MPVLDDGKTVEEVYWDLLRAMSPAEKIRRNVAMSRSWHETFRKKIQNAYPEKSEHELRLLFAVRMYGGDPQTMELIEMARRRNENAPDD